MINHGESPYLQVMWHDPVTGRPGFLVIDRLVRGVCSGGLRMRAGCTLDEVAGLAAGMTAKEALNYDPDDRYIPLGETHRLTNNGTEELVLVEVQCGNYLGEDDIVRLADTYGRA